MREQRIFRNQRSAAEQPPIRQPALDRTSIEISWRDAPAKVIVIGHPSIEMAREVCCVEVKPVCRQGHEDAGSGSDRSRQIRPRTYRTFESRTVGFPLGACDRRPKASLQGLSICRRETGPSREKEFWQENAAMHETILGALAGLKWAPPKSG